MNYSLLSNTELQILLKFAHKTDASQSEELTGKLLERKHQSRLFLEGIIDKVKAELSNDNKEYSSGIELLEAFSLNLEREKEGLNNSEYLSKDIKEDLINKLYESVHSAVYDEILDYGWYTGHSQEIKKNMLIEIECYKVPNEIIEKMDIKNLEFLLDNIEKFESVNEIKTESHRKMKM